MTSLLLNHVWQSTLFAVACGLATLALRNNRAQVRHALWLAASLKFLIPFAALVALGHQLGWRTTAVTPLSFDRPFVVDAWAGPLIESASRVVSVPAVSSSMPWPWSVTTLAYAIWLAGASLLVFVWSVKWRRVTRALDGAQPLTSGREWEIWSRISAAWTRRPPIALLALESSMEPGIIGVLRPRLLWPRAITDRLSDEHIEAIMAHELSHVRRRDNLAALGQMAVQAAFWFHPLVWWIGARLMDERERACDEDVLRIVNFPEVYAESLLKTCRFSLESPLACVSGVTGADLKKRIVQIMSGGQTNRLGRAKRIVLTSGATLALVAPITIGVLQAPRLRAQAAQSADATPQRFEVASVKANNSGGVGRVSLMIQPGGRLNAVNVPLKMLIRFAYQLQEFQIVGGPDWTEAERFDIAAKAPGELPLTGPGTVGPGTLMMQSLLVDRFKLIAHTEKREMPMYALVMARSDGKLGNGLPRSTVDCKAIRDAELARGVPPTVLPPGERPPCGFRIGPGRMFGGGVPLIQLATALSPFVQRVVVDQTGLTGEFDIDLTFSPEQIGELLLKDAPRPAPDPEKSSLFTALQEQLGLKLQAMRGPVDVLVIEHVERPTPD